MSIMLSSSPTLLLPSHSRQNRFKTLLALAFCDACLDFFAFSFQPDAAVRQAYMNPFLVSWKENGFLKNACKRGVFLDVVVLTLWGITFPVGRGEKGSSIHRMPFSWVQGATLVPGRLVGYLKSSRLEGTQRAHTFGASRACRTAHPTAHVAAKRDKCIGRCPCPYDRANVSHRPWKYGIVPHSGSNAAAAAAAAAPFLSLSSLINNVTLTRNGFGKLGLAFGPT
jgi:hypothetical protein